MPSPKDGTPGNLVEPAAPTEALDAADAEAGKVETVEAGQQQKKTGKYGTSNIKPFKGAKSTPASSTGGGGGGSDYTEPEDKPKTSWIEIVLVDDNDKPVPGEPYKVTLPDDSVKEGTLDDKGFARIADCDPGTCKVTFPMMDGKSWKKV